MEKISGGYALVPHRSLCDLSQKLSVRSISVKDVRANFALIEMRAIRAAAAAVRAKRRKGTISSKPTANELGRITGLNPKFSKALFKQPSVSEIGSEKGRLIPVPRRLLRYLAQASRRSLILTLLTYLERGLSLRNGTIRSAGTAKASLIALKTGLSLRAVRLARAVLLREGILTPDTTKFQRKLNRDGAYFTINLSWGKGNLSKNPVPRREQNGVSERAVGTAKLSPLPSISARHFAPPLETRSSSNEVRNQRSDFTQIKKSGFYEKTKSEPQNLDSPDLKNVTLRDIEDFSRCERLFEKACDAGWLKRCEASKLNWIAAAIRAKEVGKKDPNSDAVKVFLGIVKRKLWGNINRSHEERAKQAITKYSGRDSSHVLGTNLVKQLVARACAGLPRQKTA